MDTIAIIHHQNKSQTDSPALKGVSHLSWKTCLRELIFISQSDSPKFSNEFEILTERRAFAELLEIICGLKSPVIGETQVFGQFKSFIRQHQQENHPLIVRNWNFFQALLNEAKSLREQNRGLLNSAGYGSVTRKLLKNYEKIALIGTGELAGEIFALNQKSKRCSVFTRNTSKDFFGVDLQPLQKLSADFDAVVVAAPIANDTLEPHLHQWKMVIDWRGETSLPNPPLATHYFPITQLFKIVEDEKRQSLVKAEQVRHTIQKRTDAFFERVSFRPLGWDDVCA